MKGFLLAVLIGAGLIFSAQHVFSEDAAMTPLMVSLLTPAQVPAPEWDVKGLRINLFYGRCNDLYGADLGLVNHTAGQSTGLDIGLVNYVEGKLIGFQAGGVNVGNRVKALQIGVYNKADDISGLQIGLINHTRMMRGVQIGLINVIESNDLSFMPIVNFFF
ncbi:MAG: hypothetical protein AB7E95_03345 [Kiritimatiellales bacterium]